MQHNPEKMARYTVMINNREIAEVSNMEDAHRICKENGHPVTQMELYEQYASYTIEIRDVTIIKQVRA